MRLASVRLGLCLTRRASGRASDYLLKNRGNSERRVFPSESLAEVLQDYIDHERFDVQDEYGRNPLFTTRKGRANKNTIRRYIRTATRPCKYGDGCRFDEDPADYAAQSNRHNAGDYLGVTTSHPPRRVPSRTRTRTRTLDATCRSAWCRTDVTCRLMY